MHTFFKHFVIKYSIKVCILLLSNGYIRYTPFAVLYLGLYNEHDVHVLFFFNPK